VINADWEFASFAPVFQGFRGFGLAASTDREYDSASAFPEIDSHFYGGRVMDDTAYRGFFEHPTQTYHRRYEALRAVFVDQRSQKEAAQAFGFTYDSMRQLVREFRQGCDAEDQSESPFFETFNAGAAPPLRTMTIVPSNHP